MVEEVADSIRREPFHSLRNNCLVKSFRFKRECARRGIEARVVISLGYTRVMRRIRLTIPIIHAWGEVEGRRIEVARPLDEPSVWGTLDSEVKPLVAIWI
jgi:hypothetical protein